MEAIVDTRIANLKAEIASLERQQKQQAVQEKEAHLWRRADKSSPKDDSRVIAWSGQQAKAAWFSNDSFFEYDGTWMLKNKDKIHNVTHWMGTDWMGSEYWPMRGPGIKNALRYYWARLTQGATNISYRALPKSWNRQAQLGHKPVFYFNNKTGEITAGLPEYINAPRGYQRVVCTSASEAEGWSERQRRWDKAKHSKIVEERMAKEEEIHKEIRSELHSRMANARNAYNREFLRRAIETSENQPNKWKYERESYMHCEGYERNH